MTPDEIRTKRMGLGITQGQAARIWGLGSARTWRRWEAGSLPMATPAALLLTIVASVPAAWRALRALRDSDPEAPDDDDDNHEDQP